MKIIRTSTVPVSLDIFCRGLFFDLKQEGYEIIALSSPGKELKEIELREGVKTYSVKMARRISPLNDVISLCKLIKILKKEKPDIVHSITPKAGLLSMLAAKITNVPCRLHTFTGLIFPTSRGLKRQLLKATDRLTCSWATHVIAEGEGVRKDLSRNGITAKTLTILGNGSLCGIDINHFDPDLPEILEKASDIKDDGKKTFLFVGRLIHDKGLRELVEAFTRLNKEYPDTRLVLVGNPEPTISPLNKETISMINNNSSIITPGFQSDVRPWIAAADILVLPSYREGFPNVVLEACSMGVPVIVTDINGSNEIIKDGYNGVIIPAADTGALYEAMTGFVKEKIKFVSKLEIRNSVANRYEQTFVRSCLKDFYRSVIKS